MVSPASLVTGNFVLVGKVISFGRVKTNWSPLLMAKLSSNCAWKIKVFVA